MFQSSISTISHWQPLFLLLKGSDFLLHQGKKTMERIWWLGFLFLLTALSCSHSTSTSRTLLQMKKACPIQFEFQNYTIITSQCKGPDYPAHRCCAAFKQFACPFAKQINDLTTDCASTMFSYINLYGKYPPGLFATKCREGKEGLKC